MRRMLLLLAVLVASMATVVPCASAAEPEELGVPLQDSHFAGAIAVGADGSVWFTSHSYNGAPAALGKVAADGTVTEYQAPIGAESIVAGGDGNFWFAEANGIGRVTPAGEITSFPLPAGSGAPRALATGPDGDVRFVTGRPAALGRIAPDGAMTMRALKVAGRPQALAVDAAGNAWFAEPEADRIGRVTAAGKERELTLPSGTMPRSLAVGPDGSVWFNDHAHPRVGRMTPTGKVKFFAVPTITPTDQVHAGPEGQIWFTARNEIGTITSAGQVGWPVCYAALCGYPPTALATGPDGRLWIASGVGHCPSYCGAGSEMGYTLFGHSNIGAYALPTTPLGIGPTLAPVRKGKTALVVGCGLATRCVGTLRLKALVRPKGAEANSLRQVAQVPYSLAPGAIAKLTVPFSAKRWDRLRGSRGFLVVEAVQDGASVGQRGFYFAPRKGGSAKQFF